MGNCVKGLEAFGGKKAYCCEMAAELSLPGATFATRNSAKVEYGGAPAILNWHGAALAFLKKSRRYGRKLGLLSGGFRVKEIEAFDDQNDTMHSTD